MDFSALPFTLRQAQYALAVADTRSFRQAAERCAVAQPSLSSQVAALEAALETPLFERGRGGVRPTPAGSALLPRFRALLQAAEDTLREARTFADPLAGPLRLGVIPTLAPYLLPRIAPVLRKAFPKLQILWTEGRTPDLVKALEEGRLEGALLALEADLGDLETLPLGRDDFHLCAPKGHPLVKGCRTVRLEDLEGARLLLLEDGHCLRDQALAACRSTRVEETGFRATSLPTLVQMVASGAGLTLLPELALPTETTRAAVTVRPFAEPAPHRTLGLAWRRNTYAREALGEIGKVLADNSGRN